MNNIESGYTGVLKSVSELDDNGNLTIAEIYPKNRDHDVFVRYNDVYGGDNKNYFEVYRIIADSLGRFDNYLSKTSPNAKSNNSNEADYVRNKINKASSASYASSAEYAVQASNSGFAIYGESLYNIDSYFFKKSDIVTSYSDDEIYPFSYTIAKQTYWRYKNESSNYMTSATNVGSASYANTAGITTCDKDGNVLTSTYYTTASKVSTANLVKTTSLSSQSDSLRNPVGNCRCRYVTSGSFVYSTSEYSSTFRRINSRVRSDLVLRFVGEFDCPTALNVYTIIYTDYKSAFMNTRFLIFLNTNAYNLNNSGSSYNGKVFEPDIYLAIPTESGVKVRSLLFPDKINNIVPWRYLISDDKPSLISFNTNNTYGFDILNSGASTSPTGNEEAAYHLRLKLNTIPSDPGAAIPGHKILVFRF